LFFAVTNRLVRFVKSDRVLVALPMTQLRIGIDVHSIGSQKGGNETYYRELVGELAKARCDHGFFLYYTHPVTAQQIAANDRFVLTRLFPAHPLLRIPFTIPRRARLDKVDVFHAQFIVPPLLKCKTVASIFDVAYEHVPQFFHPAQRAWLKMLVPSSARRADHVITLSEHSKRDIVRAYGIAEDKITVTHLGAGPDFFPRNKEKAQERLAQRYGIRGDFVLYLGRLQARKNLARLVEAYARVRKAGLRQKLVIAGKQDTLFEPIRSRIKELKLDEDILLPGYVHAEDVPVFYSAAEVFVYPSLYEGFGLPVIEAMSCGVPVITSRGSSLEEVAGNAALLIDPLDEVSIAQALMQVLGDSALRKQLGEAGLTRSKRFNFKDAARQTVAVYEQVTGAERAGESAHPMQEALSNPPR
jgi:glycosyltransferase involved in cell wall biosynthesis